jgi:elongation factor Ts
LASPAKDLYSVEQVAAQLGLHVRTVRNYVRDGRLKGVRIGKQYRIARADLEALTGHRAATPAPNSDATHRDVEVSSIVEIETIDFDAASRVTNSLLAAAKGRSEGDAPLRIDTIYDQERARLKVILIGSIAATTSLLKLVAILSGVVEHEHNMTGINATLVKTLRDKTGAGVIACKNALEETRGDFDAAVERLRAAEATKAAQKADRVAAEGLVGLLVDGTRGAIVELNTETDFVARTQAFQQTVASLAKVALEVNGDRDALLAAPAPDGDGHVSDLVVRLVARTGEHISLRRSASIAVSEGVVASYVHSAVAAGVGRIGVLVALESPALADALATLGRTLAMHIAASAPIWVSREDIPADVITEKRTALVEEAQKTGKTPEIVEKMVEGRMRKFYAEVVLRLQPFALNPEQRVEQAIEDAEKAAGAKIDVKAFVRFRTGEGIEKRTE